MCLFNKTASFIVRFSVDAVVARYKHEHIVEGLSLKEPVSRVRGIVFVRFRAVFK